MFGSRTPGPVAAGRIPAVAVAFLLASAVWPAGGQAASDVLMNCEDCPVGASERSLMARLLRECDVVFEGTFVGADTVPNGYDRWGPLEHFRIDRLLRGIAPHGEIDMMDSGWRDLPAPGTQVLAWVLRGCTYERHPCGHFVRLTHERTMFHREVSSDWRRDSRLLSCDSLVRDVVQLPDSTGLEAFDRVAAVGLARLEIRDPYNPPRPHSSGWPDNGGTWPVEGFHWVVGRSGRVPHFVRFPRVPRYISLPEVISDDRFLIPLLPDDRGDTLVVKWNWRPMLVRNGEAVGFGVPADSLAALFEQDGTEYRLKISRGPAR